MQYNTALFDAKRRSAECWATTNGLLHSVVREPQQHVSRLALLNSAERHQLLREWNETATPYETDVTFGELFEQQVARDADGSRGSAMERGKLLMAS